MPSFFDTQWLNSEFIHALSWTLIHSLWQGLAAAVIAGLVIMTTKRSPAALRYNLLSAIFVLFIAGTIVTFFLEYRPHSDSIQLQKKSFASILQINNVVTGGDVTSVKDPQTFLQKFNAYFDRNAPLIVFAWFVLFMIQCLKLLGGLYHIENIKRKKITPVPAHWNEKLQQMTEALGIQQQVMFLQSGLVKMPIVLGVFKPAIFVPLGILSNLPAEQVETILLHELAHIRRKDFLVNLLQSFAESIFFFNPAVRWISGIIREEREACCDDIVVAYTTNKSSYLQALVSFQEISLQNNNYAMALGGDSSLIHRVKRMLTYENKKLNIMEKLLLVSGLVVFTAFSIVRNNDHTTIALPAAIKTASVEKKKSVSASFIQNNIQKEKLQKEIKHKEKPATVSTLMNVVMDTVPKTNYSHVSTNIDNDGTTKTMDMKIRDDNGKTYRVKKLNDKVTDFYVDDVRVPDAEIGKYKDVLDQMDVMEKQREEMAAQRREEARQRREEMTVKRKEMMEQRQVENEKREKEREMKMNENREKMETRRKEMDEKREAQREKSRELLENYNHGETRRNYSGGNEVSSIVSDLSRENIISSSDNISFSLDKNSFIVNGKKQPAEIHDKFKEKFIHGNGDSIKYSKSGHTTTTTINRD